MKKNIEENYAAPKSIVEDEVSEVLYAGFWIRALASFIDSIWQMPLIFAIGYLVYGASYFDSEEFFKGPFDVFLQFIFLMILVIGFWFYRSATPGKELLGLKIVNASDLGAATNGQLVKRYVGYYLSMIPLCLGFFWVAFDKKKQGFHDKVSNTVVIYYRSNKSSHSAS